MDKKIIELHKVLYPEEYKTVYIYTYPLFNQELKELINKSGYEKEFKIKYYKSLRFLENLKRNCIMNTHLFEQLVNAEGIYSIILKGTMNIRILFDFQYYDEIEIAVLYNCFYERKLSDYKEKIASAIARRQEIFPKGGRNDG